MDEDSAGGLAGWTVGRDWSQGPVRAVVNSAKI